jgi:hypothetical protein
MLSTEEQFAPVDLTPSDDPSNKVPPPDGFADELFAPLDVRPSPASFADQLGEIAEEEQLGPALPDAEDAPPAPPAPPPAPAAPPAPEVIEYEDGSTLSIDKTGKGWRAVLDSGSGNPEIFYGKTKDEMWSNVAAAKMHATRHIRDLDRKIKLTARPAPALPPQTAQPVPQARPLTADEIFEIKNQLKDDPGLALDTYFQKRTGLTIDQLVGLANQGSLAKSELDNEATVRVFKSQHPEYLMLDDNYKAMLGWLAKYKLGKTLTDKNQDEMMDAVCRAGAWTPESLDEAFQDLAQDGLLELEPGPSDEDEPEPQAVPAPALPAQPAAPAPSSRIANVRVGQRAGLGLRQRETVNVPRTGAPRPPSDEEFESMTDAEIAAQFAAVRRYASQTRR